MNAFRWRAVPTHLAASASVLSEAISNATDTLEVMYPTVTMFDVESTEAMRKS